MIESELLANHYANDRCDLGLVSYMYGSVQSATL